MAGMYVFGVVIALLLALALKWTDVRGEPSPVTVLPPYRVRASRTGPLVWARCWHFLSRAGQVIFMVSLVLWAMAMFPATRACSPSGVGRRRGRALPASEARDAALQTCATASPPPASKEASWA